MINRVRPALVSGAPPACHIRRWLLHHEGVTAVVAQVSVRHQPKVYGAAKSSAWSDIADAHEQRGGGGGGGGGTGAAAAAKGDRHHKSSKRQRKDAGGSKVCPPGSGVCFGAGRHAATAGRPARAS